MGSPGDTFRPGVPGLPGLCPPKRQHVFNYWSTRKWMPKKNYPSCPWYVLPSLMTLSLATASSCGSERLFSLCKLVLTPTRRGMMGHDTFEALVFLSVLARSTASKGTPVEAVFMEE